MIWNYSSNTVTVGQLIPATCFDGDPPSWDVDKVARRNFKVEHESIQAGRLSADRFAVAYILLTSPVFTLQQLMHK